MKGDAYLVGRYAEEAKFLGTYAEPRWALTDASLRYKQNGVQRAPGRLSSAGLLDGQGGNMQNQPVQEGVRLRPVFGYIDLCGRVVGWQPGLMERSV
jgi:hypothetical protein